MTDIEKVQAVLLATGGQINYKYPTGQISTVTLDIAGLRTKRIRVANLPPETSQEELRASLTPYGKIINIETERWSKHYRCAVDNGVRQVTIMMNRHIPSLLSVAGCRVLLSYEGQPATCYGCGEVGHVYLGCPIRQKSNQARIAQTQQTYANVVSAPTERNEHHPTTMTVDEEQHATPVPPDATLHKMTEVQPDIDKTSNKSGTIIPQHQEMEQTIDKEGRHVLTDNVDCVESMETTEYQAVDNTCAGRAEQGGEDPQPRDTMPEAQRNNPQATELKPKRESEEGTEVQAEAASTLPDKGHPPTDAPDSPTRNKKLKTDRNGEQKQDMTRSLTRKAANKGKI